MALLQKDIAAFDLMRAELESKFDKQWVVFQGGRFIGAYAGFEAAAAAAVAQFDPGPYLIRQVGAQPVKLFGGMVFTPAHALDAGRI